MRVYWRAKRNIQCFRDLFVCHVLEKGQCHRFSPPFGGNVSSAESTIRRVFLLEGALLGTVSWSSTCWNSPSSSSTFRCT